MNEQQTPQSLTEERLKEIEERLKRLPGGTWYAEEDEHCWQLFAESEATFHGPFGPISGHPWQLIKAPKKDTPYAEYWPTPEVSAFLTNARRDVPALLAEIRRLRAKLQEQENTIAQGQAVPWMRAERTENLVTIGRELPFPCAKCGGSHQYLHYMATMNQDGSVAKGEWVGVGCTGPKAPTVSNKGGGETPCP